MASFLPGTIGFARYRGQAESKGPPHGKTIREKNKDNSGRATTLGGDNPPYKTILERVQWGENKTPKLRSRPDIETITRNIWKTREGETNQGRRNQQGKLRGGPEGAPPPPR